MGRTNFVVPILTGLAAVMWMVTGDPWCLRWFVAMSVVALCAELRLIADAIAEADHG